MGMREDIPAQLSQMDYFVLPSLWEGMPIVLLEAMAARRPIVATDVNGVTELLQHSVHAVLVPPRNAEALAAGVTALIEQPAYTSALVEAAFRRVSDSFSSKRMAADIEALYIRLLSKS
jgi:glycosyltransferase involved in cell wall biosynthesis